MSRPRTQVELDIVQPAKGRSHCTPIGRLRRSTWNIRSEPHRTLLVQQKGSPVQGAQGAGNLAQVRFQKIQQLMLPGQAVEIEWWMLHVEHDRPVALQQEDIVCIATFEPLDGNRCWKTVPVADRPQQICGRAREVSRWAHPASVSENHPLRLAHSPASACRRSLRFGH